MPPFENEASDGKVLGESVLFITYDGLLDPLGGSQILPYVYSIAEHPRSVHVISFEKPARFREGGDNLKKELRDKGVNTREQSNRAGGGLRFRQVHRHRPVAGPDRAAGGTGISRRPAADR